MKKILSSILAALLVLTALPWAAMPVNATESGYDYSVSDGEVTITGFDTSIIGDVSIPSTLGGYPVTAIGDFAFSSCKSITSITIPDGVTTIGYFAFSYSSSITSITIPDSVTSIGEAAFFSCSSLTSITIPDSVTSIGESVFECCSSLQTIIVDSRNTKYSSIDGVLFNKDRTELITYPPEKSDTTYTIPDNVTSIGRCAFFSCSSITSIAIPDGVTSIGEYAFYLCDNLTSIMIADSVTSIEGYAFYGCSSLTDVYYGGTDEEWNDISIGFENQYLKIATIHFCEPDDDEIGIYTYDISNGEVTITGFDKSISGDISIPSTLGGYPVTSIGYKAFYNCSSITSIAIPDSVTSIERWAFEGCCSLIDVYYGGTEEEWNQITVSTGNDNLINAVIHFADHTHIYIEKADAEYLKTPATCNSKAVYFKSCSVCGEKSEETFEYGEFDINNHVGKIYIIDKKEATYDECGEIVYICALCGATYTEPVPVLPPMLGDVDGNGQIDGIDYKMLKAYIIGSLDKSNPFYAVNADIDGNGQVNVIDLKILKAFMLGSKSRASFE